MPLLPTIRCRRIAPALAFYTERLGFTRLGGDANPGDPAFEVLERDGDRLFLSSHSGDGAFGQALAIACDDADAEWAALRARGYVPPPHRAAESPVHAGPTDQTWGTREFYVDDPDGNTLRFIAPAPASRDEPAGTPASPAGALPPNRSMPSAPVIPVRSYPQLDLAVTWLRDVLGCHERLRIPGHRVQLTLGTGAVVVAAWDAAAAPATGGRPPATLMVRVADVDATYARALAHGGSGVDAPRDHPYGERQAVVRDPAGHSWTLSQTIADVDPAAWGGELVG